jgi:hypothetical protein
MPTHSHGSGWHTRMNGVLFMRVIPRSYKEDNGGNQVWKSEEQSQLQECSVEGQLVFEEKRQLEGSHQSERN